jgi:aromatic ring hydroxylase
VLEDHNKKVRTREIYQHIREITGKPKTSTSTIISKTRAEYIEKVNILRRWKEYTEGLYQRDPNVSIAFQEKNIHTRTSGNGK